MTEKKLPVLENEAERQIALRTYHIIDRDGKNNFDEIASIASVICGTSISLITSIDEEARNTKNWTTFYQNWLKLRTSQSLAGGTFN